MIRQALLGGLAAVVAALAVVAGTAGQASANGVPQLVKLTYLEGISNFGPKDAEGVLEFSFAEAYAHTDVKNLKPADGYTYEGWLLGPGKPLFVGKLEPNSSGIGSMDVKLEDLASYDYNTFVIAARKAGAPEGQLPADVSIAGRFTVIGDDGKSQAGGDIRPGALPDTGEKAPPTLRERAGRTLMVTGAVAGVSLLFLRYWRGRRSLA